MTTQNQQEQLKALFGARTIYAREIPNEFCGPKCCPGNVWLIVTTDKGHVKVGWRNRVIVIDWTDSDVGWSADNLFPDENVTKLGRSIHAWSYADAERYLRVILGDELCASKPT